MDCCRIKIDSYDLNKIFSKKEIESLLLKKYKKGEIVYFDSNDIKLLMIKSGKVKVSLLYENKEFTLYYLQKNNIYIPYSDSIFEILEDCEIYEVKASQYTEIFSNTMFCNLVLNNIAKISFIEKDIIKGIVFTNCKKRLLYFIYDVAKTEGIPTKNGIIVDLKLKIGELATFIASERQTSSKAINELIKAGLLEKLDNYKYLIKDFDKLKSLID